MKIILIIVFYPFIVIIAPFDQSIYNTHQFVKIHISHNLAIVQMYLKQIGSFIVNYFDLPLIFVAIN